MKTIFRKSTLLISSFIVIFLIYFVINGVIIQDSYADDLDVTFTVGNSAPSLSGNVAENPASTSASPTDEDTNVTFEGTATDSNGDQYYLAICQGAGISGNAGAPPTCTSGNWCISGATDSGSQASCNYSAVAATESNDWYAYVCDGDSSSPQCSGVNQGSGDSGSPFYINHYPTFSAIEDDGGSGADSTANPNGTMTFNATASDSDTSGQVMLIVCDGNSTGATSSGCTGGQQLGSAVLTGSNPTCNFSVPSVAPDDCSDVSGASCTGTDYDYQAFVFDDHDLGSDSNSRDGVYDIANVSPSVSSVTLNSGSAMDLVNADTTTDFTVTATVSDNNGCADLNTIQAFVYRSSIAYSGCDTSGEAENNYCYPEVSCSSGGGNSCDAMDTSSYYGDSGDAGESFTCTASIQYHADPTDANTTYSAQNWLDTVKAIDDDSATGNTEVAAGVEMNSFMSYDVQESTIGYGTLGIGEIADGTNLPENTTVEATGNVGLDEELSGANMCTDYPTCIEETVVVGQQKYNIISTVTYAGGTALTTGAVEKELNCNKTTSTGSNQTELTYWGLQIPVGTASGSYTGSNTIVGVKGEFADW